MICAWFVTSSLIWGLIPNLSFLESLIIGACVTPTDPVLANSICKGAPISPSRLALVLTEDSGANTG
jgi:NhaP-type Na+/H+ or K+/H+ antiporter